MPIGQDLLNVPMGDMIRQMAFAIADAQLQLDTASIRVAEMMGGIRVLRDVNGNLIDETGNLVPLNAQGEPGQAHTQDTRIYFGYDYAADGTTRIPQKLSMLELGFTPTFHQFIDTIIEVK